jgi:hypothetical protein
MDYKSILGVLAVIIGLVGYVPYLRNIFNGKTKPHAFSWLVWGILTGIAFVAQVHSKGGAGAWVTGFTAGVCIFIFMLALWKGAKDFPLVDWLALAGAGVASLLWLVTNGPLAAVILVTIIDALGFIPTFRKSYIRPNEETTFTYSLSGLKFVVGIIALQHYSAVNIIYPASLVITNGIFVLMVLSRRAQLARA